MISTAIFDLETSALEGDRGIILCGVIKSSLYKKPLVIRTDRNNPGWSKGLRGDDSETVEAISDLLSQHDVLVAHNGEFFDLPMLRARRAHWNMPRLPDLKIVDPWKIAKRKFRLGSNSLGRIADHLGIKDRKTPLDMSIWMEAVLNGSESAMDLIVEHCIADVNVLEGVFKLVKPYVKCLDDRGSAL